MLIFEPRVSLATGRIVGFEAGPAPGADHLAPRSLLAQCVAQLRTWGDLGHHGLQIALAPGNLDPAALAHTLVELLQGSGVAGSQIELEVADASLPDPQLLHALRRLGIACAIGDAAARSASLDALMRLSPDGIKVKPGTTCHAPEDANAAATARMLSGLARTLRLRWVAQGIETPAQERFFAELGCDHAQGPLFGPPLDAAQATALLEAGHLFGGGALQQHPERHLLLLDDEINVLRSLQRVLRGTPCKVHIATEPEQAFALLAREPIGVVISDQRMPTMNGTDFLARVRQLHPQVVRIVLSGYTELQSVTHAINDGAIYKFLTKPWNDKELLQDIDEAFRENEAQAEQQQAMKRLHDSNQALATQLQTRQRKVQQRSVALDVTQQALNLVPVPVLGLDQNGMVSLSNGSADALLGHGDCLMGSYIEDVLPGTLADSAGERLVELEGARYRLRRCPLTGAMRGTGSILTLVPEVRA